MITPAKSTQEESFIELQMYLGYGGFPLALNTIMLDLCSKNGFAKDTVGVVHVRVSSLKIPLYKIKAEGILTCIRAQESYICK